MQYIILRPVKSNLLQFVSKNWNWFNTTTISNVMPTIYCNLYTVFCTFGSNLLFVLYLLSKVQSKTYPLQHVQNIISNSKYINSDPHSTEAMSINKRECTIFTNFIRFIVINNGTYLHIGTSYSVYLLECCGYNNSIVIQILKWWLQSIVTIVIKVHFAENRILRT